MENLETAFLLMVVGMATVFVILLIVIYLGKLLISLVMPIDSFGIDGLTIEQQRVIAIFVMAVMLWLTEPRLPRRN